MTKTTTGWTRLKSSFLSAFHYHAASMTLDIRFKTGRILRYSGVYDTVPAEFALVASPGRYYAKSIKAAFASERIA